MADSAQSIRSMHFQLIDSQGMLIIPRQGHDELLNGWPLLSLIFGTPFAMPPALESLLRKGS